MQTDGQIQYGGQQYPGYPQYWWPPVQPGYIQEEEGGAGPCRARCNTWPRSQSWTTTDSHSPGLTSLTEETEGET